MPKRRAIHGLLNWQTYLGQVQVKCQSFCSFAWILSLDWRNDRYLIVTSSPFLILLFALKATVSPGSPSNSKFDTQEWEMRETLG